MGMCRAIVLIMLGISLSLTAADERDLSDCYVFGWEYMDRFDNRHIIRAFPRFQEKNPLLAVKLINTPEYLGFRKTEPIVQHPEARFSEFPIVQYKVNQKGADPVFHFQVWNDLSWGMNPVPLEKGFGQAEVEVVREKGAYFGAQVFDYRGHGAAAGQLVFGCRSFHKAEPKEASLKRCHLGYTSTAPRRAKQNGATYPLGDLEIPLQWKNFEQYYIDENRRVLPVPTDPAQAEAIWKTNPPAFTVRAVRITTERFDRFEFVGDIELEVSFSDASVRPGKDKWYHFPSMRYFIKAGTPVNASILMNGSKLSLSCSGD